MQKRQKSKAKEKVDEPSRLHQIFRGCSAQATAPVQVNPIILTAKKDLNKREKHLYAVYLQKQQKKILECDRRGYFHLSAMLNKT